jgi:VWFA-related protein
MKRIIAAIAFAVAAHGQTPPPLVETMEVRVVNVEVVVTDKAGNRITGLTKDDFEVFEKRQRKEITNFSEIGDEVIPPRQRATSTEAPAPAIQRRNSVIFFVDTSSLDPRRRKGVFEELRRFAGTALRPGDRGMVTTWNKRVRVVLPFNDSTEAVQRALYEVEDEPGMILVNERWTTRQRIMNALRESLENPILYPIGQAYSDSLEHAETYAEQMYAHARSLMVAVSSTLDTFAAVEDKKALVFVGDYLPSEAGSEMYQFVNDTFAPHLSGSAILDLQLEAPRTTNWLDGIVRAANATGVTMYMITGGGLQQQMTVDASEGGQAMSSTANLILELDTRDSFVRTAEATGGMAFTGGDPRKLLGQIANDFRSYYSIGFRPSGKVDGKARAISVRIKNPDYVVRYRQSYVLRSAEDEIADRVAANFYQSDEGGELVVTVRTETPVISGRNRMRVPVKVHVQGKNIALLPRDGMLAGDLTVYLCGGSDDSGHSKVLRHKQRLSIPAGDEERFRAGHLTFTFDVIVEQKAENFISAGVMDIVGGTYGLARAPVLGEPEKPKRVSTDF